MIPTEQIAAYATAIAFGFAAGYERFINRRKVLKTEADQLQLSEAKAFKERGDLMLKQAEEYRTLLEKEYQAHQVTREFHHKQSTIAQQKLLECNEKCLELQTRTDLSRLEHLLADQTTAFSKMSEVQSNALSQISLGIQELLKR